MNTYTIKGRYETKSSTTPMEFEIEWEAQTPLIAMQQIRNCMYAIGWFNILFTQIMLDDEFIPMMQALELE